MSQFNRTYEGTASQGSTFLFTEAYGAERASFEGFRDVVFFGAFVLLAAGSAVLIALGRPSALVASIESALRSL